MIGLALVALGLVVGVAALGLLVANVDPRPIDLTIFGHTVAHPSGRVAVLVVTFVVAVSASLVALGMARWLGQRPSRRSRGAGLEARDRLLRDQVRLLQVHVDNLRAELEQLQRERESLVREGELIAKLVSKSSLALGEILSLAEDRILPPDLDDQGGRPNGTMAGRRSPGAR